MSTYDENCHQYSLEAPILFIYKPIEISNSILLNNVDLMCICTFRECCIVSGLLFCLSEESLFTFVACLKWYCEFVLVLGHFYRDTDYHSPIYHETETRNNYEQYLGEL